MFSSKYTRLFIVFLLVAGGLWLLFASTNSPAPETAGRQSALQAMAPAAERVQSTIDGAEQQTSVTPVVVDLHDIPAGVYDPNNQLDRWLRGEIDLDENESMVSAAEKAAMQKEAMQLPASEKANASQSNAAAVTLAAGASFDSIDYNECCGGGGNVPPDPELAVGPNHVIAVVNVAFEIYDTNGNSLVGPTTFSSFMSGANCPSVFDPNALYDEQADRYILGIDADGLRYCLAVSQTSDPTGSWNIYSFPTGSVTDFFDYPHAGVGRDAIYMGGNIFGQISFKESRVWAFDKAAMYAGQSASYVVRSLATSEDTPQPLNLHGWNQGTWPSSGPHYFFTETGYNGADYSVYSWSNPFGANSFSKVGTVDLVNATGVSAGLPLDTPQSGGSNMQANDYRPQDFEYRNGYAWSSMAIACNPGSGTVNCVRWAQIDPANATVVDAGVYASNGEYRTFPDLAVNHCDDMAIGYTKSSTSMYPSIYVSGRESGDAAGTLQAETLLKAGELAYTAFDSVPRRWGDYTEMTIAPDGETFWYLGEYSKNTGTTSGRWGTYIGSYTFACDAGGTQNNPPNVTINSPADGATFSSGASISFAGSASDTETGDLTASLVWTSDIDGQIGTGASFSDVLSDGNHTVTATATDSKLATGSDVINISVGDPVTIHVGDLDGSGDTAPRGRWNATVMVTVHDGDELAVSGALVDGNWSNGANGGGSCTTNASGQCSISKSNLKSNVNNVAFTVSNVTSIDGDYIVGDNHDPDGDSNGAVIVVSKPGTNTAPTATITVPSDGATFASGVTIGFAGSASDAEDGDVASSLVWTSNIDGQIGTGGSFNAVLSDGYHTITAEATDSAGANGSDSVSINVGDPPPAGAMHVGDLDGNAVSADRNRWVATVTITVHDASENPVAIATVSGSWSAGTNGGGSCITNATGQCSITKTNIKGNSSSATFTVGDMTHVSNTYDYGINHDPDGDSNGTSITIAKP